MPTFFNIRTLNHLLILMIKKETGEKFGDLTRCVYSLEKATQLDQE
jgi:hypothetical protein